MVVWPKQIGRFPLAVTRFFECVGSKITVSGLSGNDKHPREKCPLLVWVCLAKDDGALTRPIVVTRVKFLSHSTTMLLPGLAINGEQALSHYCSVTNSNNIHQLTLIGMVSRLPSWHIGLLTTLKGDTAEQRNQFLKQDYHWWFHPKPDSSQRKLCICLRHFAHQTFRPSYFWAFILLGLHTLGLSYFWASLLWSL